MGEKEQMKKMELETAPTEKENQAHSNEEKMIAEFETQQSIETSSKETLQQVDKANKYSVPQNFISSDEKVNPQQKEKSNEKDHPINQNGNDLEDENKQSSTPNNKESLQPTDKENDSTDKENDSDEKDNLMNPQRKEIICSDDTITSSDATIFVQKSVSSNKQADEAVADKAESNTSFQSVDIQKQLNTPKTPLQVLSELSSNMQEMNNDEINNNDDETLTDDDNRNADDEIDSFPETIISEDAQNQLPPLPEPTLSPVQIPEAPPLDTFTSNDKLVDSSEKEYVESDNENQSERIVQDTNPPTNLPSDDGNLLRWNRMQEERRKRPRKLQVSFSENTLSLGIRMRRQPVPKSPRTRNMTKTPRKNLQQKRRRKK